MYKSRKNTKFWKSKKAERFWGEVLYYVIVIAIALLIRLVFLINAYTPTGSMENTVPTGARHFGLKCAYWFSEPERGDIIVFDAPEDVRAGEEYLKRVIGLPGDKVEIIGGYVYINDVYYQEDYLKETPRDENLGPFYVPENCVFVMGDNRNGSYDARYWPNPYIPYEDIMGKAYLMYWPEIKYLY